MSLSRKIEAPKVLALDFGPVHTGVAVSDPTGTIARPLAEVKEAAAPPGLKIISRIVADENAGSVVVGLPVTLKGEHGVQAQETAAFIELLKRSVNVPVFTWDERFTSKLADRTGGKKRPQAPVSSHSLAACRLLDDYLGSAVYRRRSSE